MSRLVECPVCERLAERLVNIQPAGGLGLAAKKTGRTVGMGCELCRFFLRTYLHTPFSADDQDHSGRRPDKHNPSLAVAKSGSGARVRSV